MFGTLAAGFSVSGPPAMSVVPETIAPKIQPWVKFYAACMPIDAQMRPVMR